MIFYCRKSERENDEISLNFAENKNGKFMTYMTKVHKPKNQNKVVIS